MDRRIFRRIVVSVMGAAALTLTTVSAARADLTVRAGWDLFTSTSGTSIPMPVVGPTSFIGVPLGTFDFTTGTSGNLGRPLGVLGVGTADTIVKRLPPDASVPGPVGALPQTTSLISLEMEALQLRSAVPIDIGAGSHFYFVTLQSRRSVAEGVGPATTGGMFITFNNDDVVPLPQPLNGTFTSFFDVFFDIRQDALTGPIVSSAELPLTNSTPTPWSHFPPTGALLIDNANNNLNGNNHGQDFFPVGTVSESHPSGTTHQVQTAQIANSPEPGALSLLTLGLLTGLGIVRRRGANR